MVDYDVETWLSSQDISLCVFNRLSSLKVSGLRHKLTEMLNVILCYHSRLTLNCFTVQWLRQKTYSYCNGQHV